MVLKRVVGILALGLGAVGVIACVGGVYAISRVQARLDRANDTAFDAVERGLTTVQDGVPVVQKRLRRSKATTEEVTAAVRELGTAEATDRVVEALRVESRAASLSGHLEAADLRLDNAATKVRDIRRLFEVAETLGAPVDPDAHDRALDLIAALRGKLGEAEGLVDEVRRF